MSKRLFILVLAGLLLMLLAGCGSNPAAGLTITPVPTLATTAELTPLAIVPGQERTATAAASVPTGTAEATSAAAGAGTPAATETEVAFEPPNCTGVDCTKNGPAITQNLKGDATSGQTIFAANCAECHGDQGKGGVPNPGSEDGTVPPLNPIDPMFTTKDPATMAKQIDLYVEHGSHTNGTQQMPNWGDSGTLTAQQIADVIAYVMSLNPSQ